MQTSLRGVLPEWHTLSSDEGSEEPVQFEIKPLDGMKWVDVLGGSYDPDTGVIDRTGIKNAFRLGVTNWRNIEDGDNPGQPLPFSRANMAKLPPGWILEMGNRVIDVSQIRGDQAKNSDSPSLSPET